MGNGGALFVHMWTWPQYEPKKKGAATANAMFKQLSAQIRELKATMRQDVADIRDKVAMWEVD